MLNHTLEENRKLKEMIMMYEKTISDQSKVQNVSYTSSKRKKKSTKKT